MALTLGELSGIISLNEKPALFSLGRVQKGMADTARAGQASTDKMAAQVKKYEAAVQSASANIAKAKRQEEAAAEAVRVAEQKLAEARQKGAAGSAAVMAAEERLATAHRRVADAQDNTLRSTRNHEVAQARLAATIRRDTKQISFDLHKMAQDVSQAGTKGGRAFTQAFVGVAGGLSAITPSAGAAGAAMLAGGGNALTFAASLTSLAGVSALVPAGLMAIGAGAGTLITAFSGVGEALKTSLDAAGAVSGANPRLAAMAVEDAMMAITVAEENAAEAQENAARRVSDAKRSLQDTIEAVAEAEKAAAAAQVAAAERVKDAKQSLQDTIAGVAEAQRNAARTVELAERREAEAARDVVAAQKALVEAREKAAARVAEVGQKLSNANLKATDTALALVRATEVYNKTKADPKAGSAQLAQLENNMAKAAAADEQAKQAVLDLRDEQKTAQAEAKAGNEKVLAAEEKLAKARQAEADAVYARKEAEAEAVKRQKDGARLVAEAQQAVTEAVEDQKAAHAAVAKTAQEGARRVADAQQSVTDATKQAEKAQVDAARAVEQAHRNLERVQMQQADAAAQTGEKSAEAMGKLTPAAQESVRALLTVKDMLGQVRRVAQENFFTGFSAPLLALAAVTIPQLVTGVGAIAAAMGAGAQIFMGALSGAMDGGVLESLLMGVAESTQILNTAITPIVQAFTTLGVVGMDYMPRLAQFIADLAGGFNTFIQAAAADGRLAAWIDGGIQSLKDLASIAGSVVGIFGALNKAAEAGGAVSTLSGMAAALNGIETTMKGEVFQTTMATLFAGAEAGAQGLLKALGPVGEAFRAGAPAMAEFLRLGGEIAGTFIGGIFTALSNPEFGAGLTTFLEHLQAGVADIVPLLPGLTGAFGLLLAALGPILETLGPSLVQVFTAFGTSLATVLSVFQPLLLAVAGSPELLGLLIGAFVATSAASAALTAAGNIQRIMMAGWVVASGLVRAAMYLLRGQWVLLGLAAIKSGAQTAAVWAMYKLEALKGAAAFVVQSAKVVGGWVAMSLAAVKSGIKTTAVWTGTVVATAASSALKFLGHAARVVGGWLLMSAQATFHALRMAAAWFIALGPIGWVIGAVVGLAAIIIANWDKISKWTKDMWEKHVKPIFDNLSRFITKDVPKAFEQGVKWIGEEWQKLQDLAKKPVKFVVEQVINKGLIDGLNGIGGLLGMKPMAHLKLPPGFRDGGYTGNKPAGAVAGVVHGDEQVIKSPSRRKFERRHPGVLDYINQTGEMPGYRNGGRVAPLKNLMVTQGYNRVHKGIDYAAPVGTPVFATQDGVVNHAGPGARAPGVWGGQEVHIAGGGVETWFAHLSRIMVAMGQQVRAGQQIALSGNTGISSGPHLHFGAFAGGWPNDIDPTAYLGGAGVPSGGVGGGGGGFNPIAAIIDGLVSKFKETFPGGGIFADLAIGVGKKILDGAAQWVTDTLGGTDKKGNATGMAPTVYDGGGWLPNTGGPQLVQHNTSKPDAVLSHDQWETMRKIAENAGNGITYAPHYEYKGEDPEAVMRRDKARFMDLMVAFE